jgi:hypothetical protein
MKKFVGGLVAIVMLLALSVTPASADIVYLSNDADIYDAIPYHVTLDSSGPNHTVYWNIEPQDGDGVTGCNISTGDLEIEIESSDPGVVTLSSSTHLFQNCVGYAQIDLIPVSEGTAEITISELSNASSGSFTYNKGSMLVSVMDDPDTTPPEITPDYSSEPNGSGWHKANFTLDWNVDDPDSDVIFTHGCGQTNWTTETDGTNTKCTAISGGGVWQQSVTVMLDKTKPWIGGMAMGWPNANGWYKNDILGAFSCSEQGTIQSYLEVNTVDATYLTTEGSNQTLYNSGTCTDYAGNTALTSSLTGLKLDKTQPSITVTVPAENAHYAKNSTVITDWSLSDSLSGIDTSTISTTDDDGVALDTSSPGNKSFYLQVEDLAGNPNTIDVYYVIDP